MYPHHECAVVVRWVNCEKRAKAGRHSATRPLEPAKRIVQHTIIITFTSITIIIFFTIIFIIIFFTIIFIVAMNINLFLQLCINLMPLSVFFNFRNLLIVSYLLPTGPLKPAKTILPYTTIIINMKIEKVADIEYNSAW